MSNWMHVNNWLTMRERGDSPGTVVMHFPNGEILLWHFYITPRPGELYLHWTGETYTIRQITHKWDSVPIIFLGERP